MNVHTYPPKRTVRAADWCKQLTLMLSGDVLFPSTMKLGYCVAEVTSAYGARTLGSRALINVVVATVVVAVRAGVVDVATIVTALFLMLAASANVQMTAVLADEAPMAPMVMVHALAHAQVPYGVVATKVTVDALTPPL